MKGFHLSYGSPILSMLILLELKVRFTLRDKQSAIVHLIILTSPVYLLTCP